MQTNRSFADRPIQLRRLTLALLAGAIACAASLVVVGLFRGGTSMGIVGPIIFVVYVVAALVIATLFGLPTLFILRALGAVNLWSTLLTGAIIGAAVGWCSPGNAAGAADVWPWLVGGILFAATSWSAWRWSERRQAA
jgi:hypothetical protein